MSNEPRARMSRLNLAFCTAAAGLAFLLLYVLSTGPFCWLLWRGYISQEQADFVGDTFYAPISWAVGRSQLVSGIVEYWVRCWTGT